MQGVEKVVGGLVADIGQREAVGEFGGVLENCAGHPRDQVSLYSIKVIAMTTARNYFSNALSSAIKGKDETKIVSLYLSLNGEMNSNNSIVGRLQNVEAHHMKTYATRTAVYWYENIKEKFSRYVIK